MLVLSFETLDRIFQHLVVDSYNTGKTKRMGIRKIEYKGYEGSS
jgi:hypothetical protein